MTTLWGVQRLKPIDDTKRSNEYVALRAELLSLHERAHAVWRWGLIAIVTLLGVVVTTQTLTNIYKLTPSYLAPFLSTGLALLLYSLAAGIIITLVKLSVSIRSSMNRL
jgi:hypothetical protein